MKAANLKLALIPAAILVLSCQAATLFAQPSENDRTTPHPGEETFTKLTPDLVSTQPAHLSPSPSRTAEHTPTPTYTVTPSPLHFQIFEELWQIVNEDYLYPDFNGLDWDAIYPEYLSWIEAGLYDDDFYVLMDEMISRLGDNHSVFLSPQQVAEEDALFAGRSDYIGIGILVAAVPQRNRAVILAALPGSPAEQAGLKPRDAILEADGIHILDEEGFLRDIVRGPEGTQVTLKVMAPGEQPRLVTLTRSRVAGSIPVPYSLLSSPGGLRIGYILLVSFADTTINDQVASALRKLSDEAPLDGLIIDNRVNEGGVYNVLRDTLSYFTNGRLGHFISRHDTRLFEVGEQDISGSQNIPLVVLIGPGTASYGEIFAGVLQDTGRAILIGERTEGNVETLWGYDFEGGSRAWIAYESFRPINQPERNWEDVGVQPDLFIGTQWDETSMDNDPAIRAALAYFDRR